jgi:hypothetical protein
MSPEQVRGDADLDGRSDVYALGVIVFEMLTGRGPFHAATPLSVALKHITEPIPSIRSFRPDLPTEVELILNKAMAKDRDARQASASDLAFELRAIAGTFQENGSPASRLERTSRNDERSTEIDVVEDSQPPIPSSSSLKSSEAESIRPEKPFDQSSRPGTSPRRSSRRLLQIAALAGVGLFLFFLCGSLGLLGTWAGLSGLFPGQTPIASPTFTAVPTENSQNIVLFADDFSDPNSGWPTQEGYGYQPDGYHISVLETGGVPWASTNRQFDNSSLYVDARPLAEGISGYYGLLCRILDPQNFYYFVIRNDGSYAIGKYKNAEFRPFFDWRQSDAIKQGNQTNRLKSDCVGSTLRFSVNDVVLGEVNDADFSAGFSGIVAAALDAPGFEVVFNNFLITEPGQ